MSRRNFCTLALLGTLSLVIPNARAKADPYEDAKAKLTAAEGEYGRWCALNRAAKESLNAGHDEEARGYAVELEALAAKYPNDWNYGNAVQDFNLVFGRLALKQGDVKKAGQHLLAAGGSKGSPQMNSFGPNMTLARDLLAKGEKAVVLDYFELCRKFWKMDDGRLDLWKKEVAEGATPNFGATLLY